MGFKGSTNTAEVMPKQNQGLYELKRNVDNFGVYFKSDAELNKKPVKPYRRILRKEA
jgi:hypothetical protein